MAQGFLSRLFGWRKLPDELSYQDARQVLEGHQRRMKRELAAREDAPPEVLYYLACDDDSRVRGLVAGNPSTPIQANELLRTDADAEVRTELARKVARLMPDMPLTERSQMEMRLVDLLEKLAEDELPRVRSVIAQEVAACERIPVRLARKLARDVEIAVCGPILQYSPLLSDEDLIEIIATVQVQGAVEAIARRENLSAAVSEAVVASLDVSAVAQLLTNESAEICEETLEKVISQAAGIEAWHRPLVMRTELSLRAARRIATFVSRSLIEALKERHDLDDDTANLLKTRAEQRLGRPSLEEGGVTREVVQQAYKDGRLGDEMVSEAAMMSQKASIVTALSLLARTSPVQVEKVLDAKSGRGIAALCWVAGLSMRTALAIQTSVARVPKDNLVLPRDGIDYPMDEVEMRWHLQYFDIGPVVS